MLKKKTGKYLNESGIALAEVFPIPVSVLGKHWERGKAKGNCLLLPYFSSAFQVERERECVSREQSERVFSSSFVCSVCSVERPERAEREIEEDSVLLFFSPGVVPIERKERAS